MTAKQHLAKAREAYGLGQRTQAERHIATARKKQELSPAELAEGLGRSKGWVRDFLGQHRPTLAKPFTDEESSR